MINNIILDLGNVCVTFQPEQYFQNKWQKDCTSLCAKLFRSRLWNDYDQGLIEKADLYEVFIGDEDQEALHQMIDEWSGLLALIPETAMHIQMLKHCGFHVYLLSNTSEEGAKKCLSLSPAFDLVDGAVYSYAYQINKPDVRLFEAFLKKYDLKPEECVFIDDKLENVESARSLGMIGLVCDDVTSTFHQLWKLIREEEACCRREA